MKPDSIRGKTFRCTFTDGPLAKKTFEHSFEEKGRSHVDSFIDSV